MTVVVEATVTFPPSSRRKPGSSVVRFAAEFVQHTPIDFDSIDLGADDFACSG